MFTGLPIYEISLPINLLEGSDVVDTQCNNYELSPH